MRSEEPELLSATSGRGRSYVSPIGSRRVEVTLAVAMSLCGVFFSFQSAPALLTQWRVMDSALGLAVVVLVFGSIALAGLAAVLRQWTRPIFLTAAVAYLIALALWPASLVQPFPHDQIPWIVELTTVPSGFVTVARRDPLVPALYAVAVAVVIGLLRLTPAGGGVDAGRATLDAIYALALSSALVILTAAVRLAASSVDQAQSKALQRYAAAQVDQAMETERVATDALVHDSVLTTFLSAAVAATPQSKALAAHMARNAMRHLTRATVAAETGPRIRLAELIPRIRAEADGIADRFAFRSNGVRDEEIPKAVAEALVLAIVQAMVNSVKHAGGDEVQRSVTVSSVGEGSVRVVVADRGRGFDPNAVTNERLGVRVSILERVRLAGGEAELRSAPGRGTSVVLAWPAAAQQPEVAEEREAVGLP